jgi:hypothetical protein
LGNQQGHAMSDHNNGNDGSLVPTGRRDLAPVAPTNPLVSRGLADLAQARLPTMANAPLKHAPFWDKLIERIAQLKKVHTEKHGATSKKSNETPRQQPDEDT